MWDLQESVEPISKDLPKLEEDKLTRPEEAVGLQKLVGGLVKVNSVHVFKIQLTKTVKTDQFDFQCCSSRALQLEPTCKEGTCLVFYCSSRSFL